MRALGRWGNGDLSGSIDILEALGLARTMSGQEVLVLGDDDGTLRDLVRWPLVVHSISLRLRTPHLLVRRAIDARPYARVRRGCWGSTGIGE